MSCITAYFSCSSGVNDDICCPKNDAEESDSVPESDAGKEEDDGGNDAEEVGGDAKGDEQAVEDVEASERPLEYAAVLELAVELDIDEVR